MKYVVQKQKVSKSLLLIRLVVFTCISLNLYMYADDISTESENEDLVKSENCMKVVNNAKFDDCQNVPTKPLYALIITPTRELAIQIKNHLTQAAKYTDINVRQICFLCIYVLHMC